MYRPAHHPVEAQARDIAKLMSTIGSKSYSKPPYRPGFIKLKMPVARSSSMVSDGTDMAFSAAAARSQIRGTT
jgi:hypothetical protein